MVSDLIAALTSVAHSTDFSGEADHVVCSLLKQYLREMPDPLCTFEYVEEFLFVGSIDDKAEQMELLTDLINNSIPTENATALEFIISFLLYVLDNLSRSDWFSKIISKSAENQMTSTNLASLIAPNILYKKNVGAILSDSMTGNIVIDFIINNHASLFKNIPKQPILEPVQQIGEPTKQTPRATEAESVEQAEPAAETAPSEPREPNLEHADEDADAKPVGDKEVCIFFLANLIPRLQKGADVLPRRSRTERTRRK